MPPQKPLLLPPSRGSRARSWPWVKFQGRVGVGTEGLTEGPGRARAGGGGPPSSGSPQPPGALSILSAPTAPVCIPRCTSCSPKQSQGPPLAETLGRPSPNPRLRLSWLEREGPG